jgi:hypothetical protein
MLPKLTRERAGSKDFVNPCGNARGRSGSLLAVRVVPIRDNSRHEQRFGPSANVAAHLEGPDQCAAMR